MEIKEDVLVTETGHLVIAPGTEIVVKPSEGSRTDPAFYSTETEILVRGKLTAEGSAAAPVTFRGEVDSVTWAGIIADGPAASMALSGTAVTGSHAGLTLIDAVATLSGSTFSRGRYGAVLLGSSSARFTDCRLEGNAFGLADFAGGAALERTTVSGNRERDTLDRRALEGYRPPPWFRLPFRQSPAAGETEYLGDQAIAADAEWSGRVFIRGQVAVQPGATLTIRPGTVVAFRRLDTNGDGLGESQLLVLGTLKVMGEPENWVLFTSAEARGAPGDWDKVSLVSSDSAENVIRHARFEYGYQAFHNHFSRARLEAVAFSDNYRGVQFQESPLTTVSGAWFTRNKSAMRFRDSRVELSDVLLENNVTGINYLRCDTAVRDAVITGTLFDPLLGRESRTDLERVMVVANREGPRFRGDGSTLALRLCAVHRNLEDGLSLTEASADIRSSDLSGNGLDGLSVTGGKVTVSGSNLAGNGRWAVDNNGPSAVSAGGNWWGTTGGDAAGRMIFDRADDAAVGPVLLDPLRPAPPGLFFAGLEPAAAPWSGDIDVVGDFDWPAGLDLTLLPRTTVRFQPVSEWSPIDCRRDHPYFPGSELIVVGGAVTAAGEKGRPVVFTGLETVSRRPSWGAVNVEKAGKVAFSWCLFTGADTGLHLRETAGTVEHCRFEGNAVAGLRLNTAKLTVRDNLFAGNGAGIRFHYGEPEIAGNLFRGNDKGIFITDDPRKFSITGNDFTDNAEYNLTLGEEVAGDVPAPGNWWGTVAEKEIEKKLFDKEDDPALGRVIYLPLAVRPSKDPDVP